MDWLGNPKVQVKL